MVVSTRAAPKRKADPDFEYDLEGLVERLCIEDQEENREDAEDEEKDVPLSELSTLPFQQWFPFELLPYILSFVDDCRDLYNVSLCCKDFQKAITSESIIRSAIFYGGAQEAAMKSVMEAIEKQSIYLPSTSRLLRLAIGTRCERMGDCFSYNLNDKVSENVTGGKRPFGLCICKTCTNACPELLNYEQRRDLGSIERISAFGSRLLCLPHLEYCTGDKSGPFLLAREIMQVFNSYDEAEPQKEALKLKLEDVDGKITEETKAEAEILVDAFLRAQSDKVQFLDAASKAKVAKKRERVESVYSKIVSQLANYEHKDILLEGRWDETTGILLLSNEVSKFILGPLLSAPSQASNKRIMSKVIQVQSIYNRVLDEFSSTSTNVLSFLADSNHPHLKAIYACRSRLALNFEALHAWQVHHFVEMLVRGQPLTALFWILNPSDLREAFVRRAIRGNTNQRQRRLATKIWEMGARSFWPSTLNEERYREKYDNRIAEYSMISRRLAVYLEREETKQFLAETGPPPGKSHQTFSRSDATDKLFDLPENTKDLLREQRYRSLLRFHKKLFLNHSA